jgi:hypothetical protein
MLSVPLQPRRSDESRPAQAVFGHHALGTELLFDPYEAMLSLTDESIAPKDFHLGVHLNDDFTGQVRRSFA